MDEVTDTTREDLLVLQHFMSSGNSDVLDGLFVRHRDSAYRLAFAITHNAADAEDAVQTAFLQIVTRSCRFDERRGNSVRGWIMGIVIHAGQHKAREEFRRRQRELKAGRATGRCSSVQTSRTAGRPTVRQ
jgi:DNA-directed RNA polymerase specialized sigma24 family protein